MHRHALGFLILLASTLGCTAPQRALEFPAEPGFVARAPLAEPVAPDPCPCPIPVVATRFAACCLLPVYLPLADAPQGVIRPTLPPAVTRAQPSARVAALPRLRPSRGFDPFPLFEDYRGWDMLHAGQGLDLGEGASLSGLVTSEDGPAGVFVLRVGF